MSHFTIPLNKPKIYHSKTWRNLSNQNLISNLFHMRYFFRPFVFLFIYRDEYFSKHIFRFWKPFPTLVLVGVGGGGGEVCKKNILSDNLEKYNVPCGIQNCKSCSWSLLNLCHMLYFDEFKKCIILYFCPPYFTSSIIVARLTVYSLLPSGTTTITKHRLLSLNSLLWRCKNRYQ